MKQATSELELLLVGGGHAHVQVLRRFAMKPLQGVRVTLATRDLHTPYSGMLPGHVAGIYCADQIHIDLGALAHAAGARLIHDEMTELDAASRQAGFCARPPLRYDLLSLNTGATPALSGLEGDVERVLPVKPISAFLPRFNALLERLERLAHDSGRLDVAIVGAGAGGVELCLAVAERLRRDRLDTLVRLHLLCSGAGPLVQAGRAVQRRFEQALGSRGVELHRHCRARRVGVRTLLCDNGSTLPADEVLWVTQAAAPAWAGTSGLAVTGDGFIAVNSSLQSRSHPEVFAVGDVALIPEAPRPRSGVYAVRAGPVLARNLRACIRGEALATWRPQRRALYLVSTGAQQAVAIHPYLPAWGGSWVWRLKDAIDRRFMRHFRVQAAMAAAPASEVAPMRGGRSLDQGMRCTGCGSKLDTHTLRAGLKPLGAEVAAASFEDAVCLERGDSVLWQTLDGFPLPLTDPWLSGRIAAVHALGDLHAMGAQPAGALAFAVVPYMTSAMMADDLAQLMDGVNVELKTHNCALLGGHSCTGAESMIALAISSEGDKGAGFAKGGGRPGDALILCKALGTGAVMAATRDGRLPSRYRATAIAHMLRSNAAAVPLLRAHELHGCTDVTGFGLLGHALEMAEAAGCALTLYVGAAVPLPGALTALARGHVSSLQEANEALFGQLRRNGSEAWAPAVRLLADPQTCGGLLAAVSAARAAACLEALQAAGYEDARLVGCLHAGDQHEMRAPES